MRTLCSAYPVLTYGMPASRYHAPHGFFLGKYDQAALEAYLQRHASSGLSLSPGQYNGLWKAHCSLQARQPIVDILIPTRDRSDLLQRCVESILSLTDYDNYTITVVDNDSKEAQTQAFHKKNVIACELSSNETLLETSITQLSTTLLPIDQRLSI